MIRPRIIPCLLLQGGALVKTRQFKSPQYIGDPINAVRIFNEKQADEIMVLDIDATSNGIAPDFSKIAKLAAESNMPMCYGGGIRTIEQLQRLVDMGVEKVAVSSAAIDDPTLIGKMATAAGRQSVVAVIDYREQPGGRNRYQVYTHNAAQPTRYDPLELARQFADSGAGEIVFNSISRDGEMTGYDLELAEQTTADYGIPLTFLGGAGSLQHIEELFKVTGLTGAAAGSLFVFKGKFRAVLINYPSGITKRQLWQTAQHYRGGAL
jgi:cyclase